MNKYPIGLQDFGKIRRDGFLYIDKTQLIYNLIESGNYYFLSRPRRFGKSLLLSTIKEIFNGNKKLFEGLWIHDQWNWEQTHPVIHLRFSQIAYKELGLIEAISRELDFLAKEFDIQLVEDNLALKFRELIRKAAKKGRVVILIDEYDKPITDYLEDLEKVEENRSVFKSFYSVLKDADEYIRLLLITGVSRFTKVSIFSDLNNLNDITIHRSYATIAGITQQELESNFAEEITEMQQRQPDLLSKLKFWYNGYAWHEDAERVYNPFSILKYMDGRDFRNYWFQTGTPTWLVKHMKESGEFEFENIHIDEIALGNLNVEHFSSLPVLFQTGYLTLKGYDTDAELYKLGYPNKEVEDSLNDALLSAYRNVYPASNSVAVTTDLGKALKSNDIPQMIKALDVILSTIPYDHWRAESESIFHIIVHLSFKRLGLDVRSEVHSSTGRCDILVFTDKYIFAIELKLNGTAQTALDQIFDKGYLRSYQLDARKKIAIGINFSSEKRSVEEFLVKEIE
ncbi:PD-(D/E)XK nuclease superfamily protein [Chitinophaga sp. CF118]|uniref:ATP-binding protein n=1 Tax=Chitinophaga sp. CF118 TaxID=1884367 RepID=UPI0008E1D5B2|nr:ATP-binding protein [Chitinophaga sp. CF118]SFD59626.1 PD-(D/E)XK nuclease superfamily protein [Chitinophaga sp. CF118]